MSDLDKLKAWKAANPEKVKESSKQRVKKWREKNPEKRKAQIDRANQRRKEKEYYNKNRNIIKNNYLIRNYNITLEQYNELLRKQNGTCAICKAEKCSTKKDFAVDHCHDTGKIRGLLCKDCNIGIGMFKDSIEFIKAAKEYLENI